MPRERTDLKGLQSTLNKIKNPPEEYIIPAESTNVSKSQSHTADMLQTDSRTDHVLGMRDMGFYSDQYAKDRIAGKMGYAPSKYETQQSPVNPNKYNILSKDEFDALAIPSKSTNPKPKSGALKDPTKKGGKLIKQGYGKKITPGKKTTTYAEAYKKSAKAQEQYGSLEAFTAAAKKYNASKK